jgi:ATP synthase protein I
MALFDRKQPEWIRLLALASSMGISIVLATFIGLGVGYYLDNHVFDTSPWFTLIFLILGIIAGFRNIYIIGRKAQRSGERVDRGNQAGPPSQDP